MITDKIGRRFGWKMGSTGCGVQGAVLRGAQGGMEMQSVEN